MQQNLTAGVPQDSAQSSGNPTRKQEGRSTSLPVDYILMLGDGRGVRHVNRQPVCNVIVVAGRPVDKPGAIWGRTPKRSEKLD